MVVTRSMARLALPSSPSVTSMPAKGVAVKGRQNELHGQRTPKGAHYTNSNNAGELRGAASGQQQPTATTLAGQRHIGPRQRGRQAATTAVAVAHSQAGTMTESGGCRAYTSGAALPAPAAIMHSRAYSSERCTAMVKATGVQRREDAPRTPPPRNRRSFSENHTDCYPTPKAHLLAPRPRNFDIVGEKKAYPAAGTTIVDPVTVAMVKLGSDRAESWRPEPSRQKEPPPGGPTVSSHRQLSDVILSSRVGSQQYNTMENPAAPRQVGAQDSEGPQNRTQRLACMFTPSTVAAQGHFLPGPRLADVRRELCMARVWAGGFGGQCTRAPGPNCGNLCSIHATQRATGKGLVHGLVDGPVPQSKFLEMVRAVAHGAQARAPPSAHRRPAGGSASGTATDGRRVRARASHTFRDNSKKWNSCWFGARWLNDGEDKENSDANTHIGWGRQHHSQVALMPMPAPADLGPLCAATGELHLRIGDFVCAGDGASMGRGLSNDGVSHGIGEVCLFFDDDLNRKRVLWRRFRRAEELPLTGGASGASLLHERELVETDEVLELPIQVLAPKGNCVVDVLSTADFASRSEPGTFFCRRALCSDGSGMLWDIDWDDHSRAARREAALLASAPPTAGPPSTCRLPRRTKVEAHFQAVGGHVQGFSGLQPHGVMPARSRLQRAIAAMRPGADTRLPGREAEREEVLRFLHDAVWLGGRAQVLYVSGMPGTGKTASCLEAVRQLRRPSHNAGQASFHFAHVNAMCLSHPAAVFAEICRKLPTVGQHGRRRGGCVNVLPDGPNAPLAASQCTEGQAYTMLSQFFASRNGHKPSETVVLVLDEIDCLVTQAQTVLYRIFEWLSLPNASLAVVAIANTMDLPERLLPRVSSRIGVLRVNFAPYDRAQLRTILDDRLSSACVEDTFTGDALALCAARVAATSGDARKALQVCRRAIEEKLIDCDEDDEKDPGPVTMQQLAEAEASLLRTNPASKAIVRLNLKARRLLLALVLELRRRRTQTVPFHIVLRRYEGLMALCTRSDASGRIGEKRPNSMSARYASEVIFDAQRLSAMSLLQSHGQWSLDGGVPLSLGSEGPSFELGESLDADDVANALASCPEDDLAKELLGCASVPRAFSEAYRVEEEQEEEKQVVEGEVLEGQAHVVEKVQEEKRGIECVEVMDKRCDDDGDDNSFDDHDYSDGGDDEHDLHDWEPASKARRRR